MTLRRCGREVEGTPLLREHAAYTRIEGSNPSISARFKKPLIHFKGFFFAFLKYCPDSATFLAYIQTNLLISGRIVRDLSI